MENIRAGRIVVWVTSVLTAVTVFIVVTWLAVSALGRWNSLQHATNEAHIARVNAANQAQVNQLLIASSDQQIQIHQKQAQIRLADAVGIRESQDEISKTLTPLYVQFEMVNALQAIAESGKNNTVVYIPTGANGIPLIANANPNQVTAP